MKSLFILILGLFVLPPCEAAQTQDSPIEVLKSLMSCRQNEKRIDELKSCAQSYFSKSLASDERDRLLSWLALPLKLNSPAVCPAEKNKYLREEFKEAKALLLCSDYKLLSHDKTAIFFMTLENGQYKLRNIRQ